VQPAYGGTEQTGRRPARLYEVPARFDALVFSDTARAFRLRSADQPATRVLVYDDRYGLLYQETEAFAATPRNAWMHGKSYNRHTEATRRHPLCDGSVSEYRIAGTFTDTQGWMKLRDSTFAGRSSVFFNPRT
jgi:hypothetical protein